jgi:peptidoglycan hydrolase CwlO-like protein
MYWASYRLSQEKNAQEKKRDEFDRLNAENTRLSEELDRYRKMVASKEREIVKLQKEIAEMRKYIAGAPEAGALFDDKEKEGKK